MVSFKGEVSPQMRTSLEPRLFRLAKSHGIEAEDASRKGDHQDEMDHSIQAIVLAAACLESFINAAHLQSAGKPFLPSDRTPTIKKWIDVTQGVSGGPTLDRNSSIYKRIKWLLEERNYLMHYKAGFQPPVPTRRGGVSEAVAKLTAHNASQAVAVMQDAIHEFHRLVGLPNPDWAQ